MHVRTLFRLMNSHVGSGGVEKVADNPQAESHTLTNARSDEKKNKKKNGRPVCLSNLHMLFYQRLYW